MTQNAEQLEQGSMDALYWQTVSRSLDLRPQAGRLFDRPDPVEREITDRLNGGGVGWTGDKRLDPFFMAGPGDPEGFLYLGERRNDGTRDGPQESIIRRIAESGANGLYFQAVRSHGGDGGSTENPFVDSSPDRGMDEDILQQWERWFTEMDESGITTFLLVYDDNASIWDTADAVGEPEEESDTRRPLKA